MSDADCEYHGTVTAACLECTRDNRTLSAARISTLEARNADVESENRALWAKLAAARDEVDAVGSVAKEAAEWVRRLSELAPLLHAADRREGEAEARAWLAAWDSAGAAIVENRAAAYAAARAERDEAVGLLRRARPVLGEVAALSDNTSPENMTATNIDAFLSRLAVPGPGTD